jgi:DME family drug/metabolite transporter
MLGVLFALGAAVAWAVSSLVARLGLRAMGSINGTFFSMVSSFFLLLGIAAALDGRALIALPLSALPWLALTGAFNFVLGRLFNYMSLGYIGVARATTLFSASPLFASLLAVVFFQERVTPLLLLGTATIIVGVALVASER